MSEFSLRLWVSGLIGGGDLPFKNDGGRENYFGGATGAMVAAVGAGAAAGGAAGGGGIGWPSRTMVTRLMSTGVRGLSLELRSTRAMEATSRTECASQSPKMVCLPFSWGTASSVMKNWLPLVPPPEGPAPALAMARRPGWSKVRLGSISSWKK